MRKSVIFVKRNLTINIWNIKNIVKLEIIVIIQGNIEMLRIVHSICNLNYSVPKKIPIVFHNGSNYDYHIVIKELAEKFKKHLTCLRETTWKYITFPVPIEKEVTRIGKNGEEIINNISYVLQFIDSARFMASSLSNLANYLSDGVDRIKCKFENNDEKCETSRIKYKYCDYFLGYPDFKADLIKYQYLCCNKNYQGKVCWKV